MTLTAKQENFAQCIADGLSQSDAYRAAYESDRMSDRAVWSKASSLMADGKVRGRVDELKAALADKQLWTRSDSVNTLRDIATKDGEEAAPAAARVSAVKELNAMHGFNEPSKLEVTSTLPTTIKLVAPKRGD